MRELQALSVEHYSPSLIKKTPRADCSSFRTTKTQLFPGYIFVRIDPEIVHTSVITDIPGVREFIRFGAEICTIQHSVIETLKLALLIRVNKKITQIEMCNVSPGDVAKLEVVALIECPLARRMAFFDFLNNDSMATNGSKNYRALSVISKPFVNDRIR